MNTKAAIKGLLPARVLAKLSAGRENLLIRSLRAAAAEQGLAPLVEHLAAAGDVSEQYTTMKMDSEYLRLKVLTQHAFQVALAGPALPAGTGVVVDIGDSSGAHTQYLRALHPDCKAEFLSVNLDEHAVAKIKAKGLNAMLARAEDVMKQGVTAEVFLLFETLEHLADPFNFLHALSAKSLCRRLVLTVPYVRRSRLGLHHIRQGLRAKTTAERVHLLELCPEDLRLLFAHTGWRVENERIYRQYPLRSPLRATRALWAGHDFEGFYGVVLSRDDSWSSLYADWPR